MANTVTRALVIVAVATTGIFASAGAASAAAPLARLTGVTGASVATQPSTQIKGAGKTRKFVPNNVTAAPISGTCSLTNYSFLVTNETKATQTLMYNGQQLANPVPPKQQLAVCSTTAGSGVITLKGDPKAKLSFTIT
jgi:hypothetical protein